MLKVIDNYDLKYLSRYGFKRYNYLPLYVKTIYYDKNKLYVWVEYEIDTKTRKIEFKTVNIGEQPQKFPVDNTLFDMMQDKILEKVEE
jgi:hypothetical protein